jgi:hypothetical protein
MEERPPRPAFFKRLWMVIAQPGELFNALADNPAWFPMAAFTAAMVGVALGIIPAEVYYETAAAQASPERLGDLQALPGIWYKLPVVVFGGVVMLVAPVIMSLVTYVIFVFMRGDRATFRQHLCVMSHAGVITAFGALLTTPLRIRNLNFEESLALGDFVPFLDGFLFNVLNGVDLFALWGSVVAGRGLSLLDPRRRWWPTAAVLVAALVVLAVIMAFFVP